MEPKTVYGDGHSEVVVDAENVTIWSEEGQSMVCLSRRAFEEAVLGYQRLRERAEEA
jgi:hypothetical protein